MKTTTILVLFILFLDGITYGREDYWSLALAQERGECLAQIGGVQFACPPGWNIVDEDVRGVTIRDFKREDQTTNLRIPAGHATIKLSPMPKIYSDLKQWVYAGSKMAPESIQSQDSVISDKLGLIPITILSSPQSARGFVYVSYFFQVNGKPFNLELSFTRASKKSGDYQELEKKLVTKLEPRK